MYIEYYFMGIILLPAILFALYAQIKVDTTYKKYAKVSSKNGKTAHEIAEEILRKNNITDVTVKKVKGNLTDYYSHKDKVVALSSDVYDSASVAAIGIAMHEVGHAIQYAKGYTPIKFRNLMVKVCNISSVLLWPLVLIGLMFGFFITSGSLIGNIFLWAGIGFFGFAVILNLITLPVEYNASKRAKEVISKENILTTEELSMASQVLNAAALTYVASLLVSVLNFIRFILVVGDRD